MLLNLENVTFGHAGVPTLEDVSLAVNENERIGLIGGNGEGKTTLLRIMLGELVPDRGTVFRKSGARIGYLEQSGGFDSSSTVYGAMEEVFARDIELIARLRETEAQISEANADELRVLSARCESLNKQIAARDSYRYDVKIKTVLGGMGFGGVHSQRVDTMSGGEKTKLKLCRLLLEEPDLLVLDEPTNHLDVNTLFWLEEYLNGYKGALLVVSHDRYFLDRLTSRTLELERRRVLSFKGNYTKYRALKAELVLHQEREYERQREEMARLQEYVDKNIVRASTAKSAQSRVKQLEKTELADRPAPPPAPPRFRFRFTENPYERILSTDRFDLSAGGKTLLKDAEFTLMRGEKCALLGDNGTGKSTLLKFLLSRDPRVKFGRLVKIAYYDQENADLDPEERVLDAFWGKYALLTQTDARKALAQSGLTAEDVQKRVKELSGGLRAKLELTLLQARQGNVLFLDEPTNHLDLPAREALEEALKAYEGTILFVSHDRRFIEAIANRIVCLENGKLLSFEGDYRSFLASRKKDPEKEKKAERPRQKAERAKEAQTRARVKEIETRLEAIEGEVALLDEELIRRAADYLAVREISDRLAALHAESDELYAEYELLI